MENQEHNQTLLSWQAPSFIPLQRGKAWYMIAGVIVLMLISYAIITGSATMAVVFLLLAGMFFMTHNEQPRIVEIKLTELGIQAGETFYPYNTLKDFWVVYEPPFVRTLNLHMATRSGKRIVLQLWEQDPAKVREILSQQLEEIKGIQEPFIDMLIRIFKLQ